MLREGQSTLARDLSARLEDIQETLSSKIGGCEIFSLSSLLDRPTPFLSDGQKTTAAGHSVANSGVRREREENEARGQFRNYGKGAEKYSVSDRCCRTCCVNR